MIASNPALGIERLPPAHIEHDYLRLHEIPLYLDACLEVYRPLAEVLMRAGLRISEAIDLQIADLELEETGGFIVVYRSHKKTRGRKTASGSTKGDKFRSVEIGPGLSLTLKDQLARRAEMASGDQKDAPLFVMPVRDPQSRSWPVGQRRRSGALRPQHRLAGMAQDRAAGRRAARHAAALPSPYRSSRMARWRELADVRAASTRAR